MGVYSDGEALFFAPSSFFVPFIVIDYAPRHTPTGWLTGGPMRDMSPMSEGPISPLCSFHSNRLHPTPHPDRLAGWGPHGSSLFACAGGEARHPHPAPPHGPPRGGGPLGDCGGPPAARGGGRPAGGAQVGGMLCVLGVMWGLMVGVMAGDGAVFACGAPEHCEALAWWCCGRVVPG